MTLHHEMGGSEPDYAAAMLVWTACYYAHPKPVSKAVLAKLLGSDTKLQSTLKAMGDAVYCDFGEVGFSHGEARHIERLEAMHSQAEVVPVWKVTKTQEPKRERRIGTPLRIYHEAV